MITVYAHRKAHKWCSWHDIDVAYPAKQNHERRWSTDQFCLSLMELPGAKQKFEILPWSDHISADRPGFYLCHHGGSKSMVDRFDLMRLSPQIRDQVNAGVLTLLIVFVFETFDGEITAEQYRRRLAEDLTYIGITRSESVCVLCGSWHDQSLWQQIDPRISWIWYPWFEAMTQLQLKQSDSRIKVRSAHEQHRILHLVGTARVHRQLTCVYLETVGLAQHVLSTYPVATGVDYDGLSAQTDYHMGLSSFPDLHHAVMSRKSLTAHYIDNQSPVAGLHWQGVVDYYHQCTIELITETHVSIGTTVFLTEKTFRALAWGIPFVLLAVPGSLNLLRQLGYDTFDNFWSNAYNQHQSPVHAVVSAVDQIRAIWELSHQGRALADPLIYDTIQRNQSVFWGKDHASLLYQALCDQR